MIEKKSTILLVDDTPENIQILSEILSEYRRKVAINGHIALKLAESDPQPDIILLDIMMPEIDGFEVCKRLKENPKTKNIPVIFITAKNSIDDEVEGLELGAVDFLSKPISPPSVLARVKNHLELQDAREALIQSNSILEEKNKYITDSIRYAEYIQSRILKSDTELKELLPNSFLIFQPKDIVSGDFYWFTQIENKKIISVIDCTGHGVPGAFMSMIGNTKLNEIILEKGITDSADILNSMNQAIIDELQKDKNPYSFDGMDMAICVIDEDTNLISFSGAYRPLYCLDGEELKVIKGNRKSIGELKKKHVFTKEVFPYSDCSAFFMFSDGMPDQNNEDNRKFGTKIIKEIIVNSKTLNEMNIKLLEDFNAFKGTEIQRDDVTMVGFKL